MRYLVTGGAGFIGSNLVRGLLNRGHKVVVIDDLSTGSLDNLPESEALRVLIIHPEVYLPYKIQLDSRIPGYLNILSTDHLGEGKIDGVFHLGIPSSPYLYRDNPVHYSRLAVSDWLSILEFAKLQNIRVVYASTSSIYNGNEIPWSEDMEVQVKDFYTEVRYFMERLGRLYYDFYKVRSIGLRLFAVFGENEEAKGNFANVVTQMMWAKKKGEVFELWGDGEQTRDLIYVEDVVRAFIRAMESSVECSIFNVGNGIEWTLNELTRAVGVKVKHVDNPMQNYVYRTLAYLGKAQRELGFQAKYSVGNEIDRLCLK